MVRCGLPKLCKTIRCLFAHNLPPTNLQAILVAVEVLRCHIQAGLAARSCTQDLLGVERPIQSRTLTTRTFTEEAIVSTGSLLGSVAS